MTQHKALTAPYGSWQSPITASLVAGETIRLSEVRLDGAYVYWVEGRPKENGRVVVVRALPDGSERVDVTPPFNPDQPNFNVRTRAHSYGGGAWTVRDGILIFSNFGDGRLYRQTGPGAAPEPLTPKPADTNLQWSYADGVIDADRKRWIGVQEDGTNPAAPPINCLVAVDLTGTAAQPVTKLVEGHDFFSSPRLSPDGRKLAWLAWDHPNMPWQGTTLYAADLDAAGMPAGAPQCIAGGANVSVFQPEWSPDGSALLFVSDDTKWWNLYRHSFNGKPAEALAPRSAEFGAAQWNFGMSTYAFIGPNRLVCAYVTNGVGKLALLDLAPGPGPLADLALPFDSFASVRSAGNGRIAFAAGAPDKVASIVSLNLTSDKYVVLQKASGAADNPAIARFFTTPKRIEFPTEGNKTAYGLFYPPANPGYAPGKGEKPPLVVKCHGGPTAATGSTLDLGIQFWTSRGIAVLDVNYGGSTGYGREYRDRLHLNWGIVDVDDCINGAKYVVDQGWADGKRTVISGGSAGGYTTLAALAFRNYFEGGASYYGISDLEQLTKDTHKFESHYLDWLIGPYPQEKERYRQRSPLHFARAIERPVIFFQGADDPVVPPNQTDLMVDALRSSGSTVGYILFSKESHGFRVGDNNRTALDAELQFFSFQVFGTRLAAGIMDLPAAKEQPMPPAPAKPLARTMKAFGARPEGMAAMHAPGHGGHDPHGIRNEPHQHAFIMLGTNSLFLCHLTMYKMEEHKYQVILEAKLPDWAMAEYRKLHAAYPTESFFLGNSPRDLFTVPALQARDRTAFLADIFRGIPQEPAYTHWPWDGVTPVIANVPVSVERIVHYRLFAGNMRFPETWTYLLFGSGGEAHMTNWQTKEPDVDHILSLEKAPDWLPAEQLRAGVIVDFPDIAIPAPGATPPVLCTNPLPDGTEQKVRYRGEGHRLTAKIGTTFWYCTKVANAMDPCSAQNLPCGSPTPIEFVPPA